MLLIFELKTPLPRSLSPSRNAGIVNLRSSSSMEDRAFAAKLKSSLFWVCLFCVEVKVIAGIRFCSQAGTGPSLSDWLGANMLKSSQVTVQLDLCRSSQHKTPEQSSNYIVISATVFTSAQSPKNRRRLSRGSPGWWTYPDFDLMLGTSHEDEISELRRADGLIWTLTLIWNFAKLLTGAPDYYYYYYYVSKDALELWWVGLIRSLVWTKTFGLLESPPWSSMMP